MNKTDVFCIMSGFAVFFVGIGINRPLVLVVGLVITASALAHARMSILDAQIDELKKEIASNCQRELGG